MHFQNLREETRRALELFDIDPEASLRDWMHELGVGAEIERRRSTRTRSHDARSASRAPAELELRPREREVVSLAASGYTREEIGGRLGISAETVKSHLRNARRRFGCDTMAHLVAVSLLLGEVDFDILRAEAFRAWETAW